MNELEKEIANLEEQLTQTESRLDVAALDLIFADDIMVTAPIGITVDKPMVMDEIRRAAAQAVVGRYDKDDLKVRGYGDTAVSSYRMTAWATVEGKEIKRSLCITNVWLKRNGDWQIVSRHTASLPDDTPPAGAKSGADGHFPLPPRCARQQQVGHVGTRDQQYTSSRRKQNDECGPALAQHLVF